MVGATLAVARVYAREGTRKGTRKGCPYIKILHSLESVEMESRPEYSTFR